ncbi:type VI secretion protein ImpB [Sphingomonas sp.]|uniref:Y-family DNA polymerase n=1 Tax=Sphingomonas sp. TaxID=28214 RepID=UPI001E14B6F3|nr:type VI secretion protein ImpB [Sphingomonas sp.]MBX9795266.1 type VI secretion protein ImpB [Sphingomonas sp.]
MFDNAAESYPAAAGAEMPAGPLPPRPLRWLFLDLNSYFASVEQQVQPELRGRPVLVAPVDSDTTVAIAASVEAKRFGISTGTPVWEARRRCPEIVVTLARHDRYVEFHEAIVAEVWRHIPVTHICSIDEVACRLLDNENSVATATALARRIKAGIRAHVGECLTSSVGIAPNRLLAKLASDMMKPDGLVVLTGDQLPHALFHLPLTDIAGVGPRMGRRLARAGVNDIRQLCALSPRAAGAAWGGTHGDRLWYQLHGFDLPDIASQTRTIGHSQILSPSRRGFAGARLTARRLAVKAASRLRRKGYSTGLVTLGARFEQDKARWAAEVKLAATQDNFVILAALEPLLDALHADGARRPGGCMLRQIGITLSDLRPLDGAQPGLFDAPAGTQARGLALSRAMDRINARFGRNAVSVGPLHGERLDAVGAKIAFGRIPELSEFHE